MHIKNYPYKEFSFFLKKKKKFQTQAFPSKGQIYWPDKSCKSKMLKQDSQIRCKD